MRRTSHLLFLIIVWFSTVALACNLGSQDRPPTIAPRLPGVTPQPTLGFATLAPGELPQSTAVAQLQARRDLEMYALLNEVDTDRLMIHVETMQNFYTRHINSSQTDPNRGIGATFNYLWQQFQAIRAQSPDFFVLPQEFRATFNNVTTVQRNLVGIINGTEVGAGVIVIGGHYDTRADDLNDAIGIAPGANDNGSGVAAILEMARILSRTPQRTTIIFVLFSAEEVGRQGSRAFVNDYIKGRDIDVRAMINIDTIGNVHDTRGNVNDHQVRIFSDDNNASASRQLARNINFIGYNHSLELDIEVMTSRDREGRFGDHFEFAEAGYPAVRFIEALEDGRTNTNRDTIDHVEPYYLRKTTQTILGIVRSLAGGLRPPRDIVLRDAGTDEDGARLLNLVWSTVPDASSYVVALRRPNSVIYNVQFSVLENQSGGWHRFQEFEAVAVAAVDANGLVGPLSNEYIIPVR